MGRPPRLKYFGLHLPPLTLLYHPWLHTKFNTQKVAWSFTFEILASQTYPICIRILISSPFLPQGGRILILWVSGWNSVLKIQTQCVPVWVMKLTRVSLDLVLLSASLSFLGWKEVWANQRLLNRGREDKARGLTAHFGLMPNCVSLSNAPLTRNHCFGSLGTRDRWYKALFLCVCHWLLSFGSVVVVSLGMWAVIWGGTRDSWFPELKAVLRRPKSTTSNKIPIIFLTPCTEESRPSAISRSFHLYLMPLILM